MSFAVRRLRSFFWDSTRGVREKILSRMRAHVARALAENFSQLTEHVESLTRTGNELVSEIRAAETRHQEAQARSQASEERYRETIIRYDRTLAEYQQKVGDYHQTVSESNLLAEGMIREMVRLQQQVDELAEAVDLANDTARPETEASPVTLKYRAAA